MIVKLNCSDTQVNNINESVFGPVIKTGSRCHHKNEMQEVEALQ